VKKSKQILLGIGLLGGAVVLSSLMIASKPQPEKVAEAPAPSRISVIESSPGSYRSTVISQGNVTPRWETSLTSEVSGQVISVSDKLLTGASFKRGEELARIDELSYAAALAQAQSAVANAEQNIEQEKQRSLRAAEDWKKAGFDQQPSALVLRKPQLKAAQAALDSAQAQLSKAQQDLDRTRIRAPYDGVVIERSINLGNFVQRGSVIARLYSSEAMQVFLPLRPAQLQQIDLTALLTSSAKNSTNVTLRATDSEQQWQGRTSRIQQTIDDNNRWRNLIVEIDSNLDNHPLMGQFVRAELQGKTLDNLLALPESTLSVSNKIWYVNEQNLLQSFAADIAFTQQGKIYVRIPDSHSSSNWPLKVVLTPSSAFLPGLEVAAEITGKTNGEIADTVPAATPLQDSAPAEQTLKADDADQANEADQEGTL